jgi:hypothetical protein
MTPLSIIVDIAIADCYLVIYLLLPRDLARAALWNAKKLQ